MSRFFGRVAEVRIRSDVGKFLPTSLAAGDVTGATPVVEATIQNVLDISTPLRIQFKVEKSLGGTPNTADITITNLAEASRKKLQLVRVAAELYAGYEDQPGTNRGAVNGRHPLAFLGSVRTIDHYHRGTEWITRVQCGDGEVAHRYAQTSRSWIKGTSLASVVADLASDLRVAGLDIRKLIAQVGKPQFKVLTKQRQFAAGHAIAGKALAELTKLLSPYGYTVNIQDSLLTLVHDLDVLAPGEERLIPRISPGSGMLGTPEVCSPSQLDEPPTLRVSSLLLPQLNPGGFFALETSAVGTLNSFAGQPRPLSGNYRAQKVTHAGDTHGGDWKTEIEALPAFTGATQ